MRSRLPELRLPKIGKTARWILTIGIILIPVIVLGVFYIQHSGEENQLRADIDEALTERSYLMALWQRKITDANKLLAKTTDEVAALEADLSQAESQLQSAIQRLDEEVEEDFPYDYTQAIEIGDKLFQAAVVTGVTIDSYTCKPVPPDEDTLNGVTFQVYHISLDVTGNVLNLLYFNREVSETFPDSDFTSVSTSMSGGGASMTFKLDIYCYD